jgi:hypothetical protein
MSHLCNRAVYQRAPLRYHACISLRPARLHDLDAIHWNIHRWDGWQEGVVLPKVDHRQGWPKARKGLFLTGVVGLVVLLSISALLIGTQHAATVRSTQLSAFLPTPTPVPLLAPTHAGLAVPQAAGVDLAAFAAQPQAAAWLGRAISPELVDGDGEQQVFVNGIVVRTGTQIAPQPIVAQMIAHGAAVPLGPPASPLTYAALAPAAAPAAQVPAPWWWDAGQDPTVAGIFIAQTLGSATALGHYIPAPFVPYLLRLGDWQQWLGAPATEVQDVVVPFSDGAHHLAIQAYANGVLWYDRSAPGTPVIHAQPVGEDDLAVFGLPALTIPADRAAWTLPAPLTILAQPNSQNGVATFETPFSVMLAGDDKWVGHSLWYHILWRNMLETRDGWVPAAQLALERPAHLGMQLADLDALSPQLLADASAYGANVTMAIYDPTTQHYYAYNPYEGLEMASMFKVPILVTLLHEVEQEGRGLTSDEVAEATAMIEVSDNVAEATLYDEDGGYDGVTSYINSLGIDDIYINTSGIGSTLLSPVSAVRLMEDIRAERILTPQDCQFVLNLMAHVVSYQQVGVAQTAPPGATWAMKIGYGPGMDTLWLMDSMGTVTYKGHAYDLAILSRDWQDFASGAYLVNHLCSEAVQALTGVA